TKLSQTLQMCSKSHHSNRGSESGGRGRKQRRLNLQSPLSTQESKPYRLPLMRRCKMGRCVLVAICNARGKLDQFVVGCQCKPLPTYDRQRSRPANGDGEPPGARLLWLWLNRP